MFRADFSGTLGGIGAIIRNNVKLSQSICSTLHGISSCTLPPIWAISPHIVGRTSIAGAEGATAPETLRPPDLR